MQAVKVQDYKYPTVILKNNILVGNIVTDVNGNPLADFPYSDVYVPENGLMNEGGNLGLDNGVMSNETTNDVFGNAGLGLKENFINESSNSEIGASNASYTYKLKTLPIAPNTGTVGLAA